MSESFTAHSAPALGRAHERRLRDIYRSAGWPSHDALEIDLLAAGLLERAGGQGALECLRLTDTGIQWLAGTRARNQAAFSAHEALVEKVAREMGRAGRIAWRGLALRAQVATGDEAKPLRWCVAKPDVFSIRQTSVEAYLEPVVHEVKVRRADLLGDLRQQAKRGAYLDLGECWYVLGCDARERPIAEADEIPAECGVLLWRRERFEVLRAAPRRGRAGLPFGVWMALAKATPAASSDEEVQGLLG